MLGSLQNILQAFHAAAAAGSSRTSGNSSNRSLNAALLGETLPRRRGIDERAARAAAEVRKKAAARGVLLRPQDVQTQTPPSVAQLLNMINSVNSAETNGVNENANGQVSNGTAVPGNVEASKEENQAPVGLGKTSTLNAKKHKPKTKVTSQNN